MPKTEADKLDALQKEANKAIENAANVHNMKVNYVDIRDMDVTINGSTEKLHKHLHNALQNATDAANYVSILPTEVKTALKKINLDETLLAVGDVQNNFEGLLDLHKLVRNNPVINILTDQQQNNLNMIIQDPNANTVNKLNILKENEQLLDNLNEKSIITILTIPINSNTDQTTVALAETIASSNAISKLKSIDVAEILNNGTLKGVSLTDGVIFNICQNKEVIKKIGEIEYDKKYTAAKKPQKTSVLMEKLAAEKLYDIVNISANGNELKLGGTSVPKTILGLVSNKEGITVMIKNNKDLLLPLQNSINLHYTFFIRVFVCKILCCCRI